MIIDGAKEYTTYRLDQQNQDLKKKSTDHNIILLKLISIQKPFKQKHIK